MMKVKILTIHLISTLALLGILAALGEARQSTQLLAGSVAIGLNLAVITWLADRILNKKSVALAMFVIVIKYAVLLGALVYLTSIGIEIGFPFAMGISAVFPTLIFLGYQFMRSSEDHDSL